MEILTFTVGLLMPAAVSGVTSYAKTLAGIPLSENRVAIVRGIVALLSLVGALLTQWIGGDAIDGGTVETLLLTIWNGAVATFIYFKLK